MLEERAADVPEKQASESYLTAGQLISESRQSVGLAFGRKPKPVAVFCHLMAFRD